jgi:hypothetical protein
LNHFYIAGAGVPPKAIGIFIKGHIAEAVIIDISSCMGNQ